MRTPAARRRPIALALLAALLPAPAHSSLDPGDIIVTGREEEPPGRDAVRRYGRMVEAVPVGGQIARWNRPICPSVSGIGADLQERVSARIRALAEAVGAPAAGPDCRPNLIVSFTPDANGLVEAMTKRDSTLLGMTSASERKLLRSSSLPVRWWYMTATDGEDGRPLFSESAALGLEQYRIPRSGTERYLDTYRATAINTGFRISITSAVVLVDVNQATGYRLDAVADYVAFVALARVRLLDRFDAAPSILGLFGGDPPAQGEISAWDRAYLTALYRAPVARPADAQRSWIAGEMRDQLKGDYQ